MPISPEYLGGSPINFTQTCLLAMLCFIFPPLPVFLLSGPRYTVKTKEFLVTCLLTVLFHPGGVIYSLYFIISLYPQALREAGALPSDEEALITSQVFPQTFPETRSEPPSDRPSEPRPDTKPKPDMKKKLPEVPDYDHAPPSYDESEGSSSNQPLLGDHKVQH